ncbi:restriction endonuclease subunit S [Anabaena sp. UHCC 0399]|uniref:restriction endonuclease subunit S n=1 Tax=Anabaena sp. UHCC 0399 TaxID=3110238 RepID=UPI002B1F47E1|nr:restriction endonuclease subunit S [Anabaena sp. UHCC 0399]MEA5568948.1 restriction endonuclease subunit S [Anabaena sp. UHCC 0399]
MKVDKFFQNFELLTDAPNAVVKMQEIIMRLAFSGKLTKRDISDVKVNDIFKEIKFEKKRLLEETTFREPKDFKPIHHNEILFELPKEWMWARIGELFLISSGTTPNRTNHKYFENGTEYWVKTTDLNNETVLTCEEKITKQAVLDCNLKYYPVGTVCVALYGGAGTIGKSGLLGIETTINQSVCGIYPNKYVNAKYLHLYIKLIRPLWMNFAASLRKAPNINAGVVNNMVFPLAPLEEQKRIVEKCDRLLSTCDEIEKRQQQRQQSILRMNESAIAQLLTSQNPEEFRQHWQRICNNFDLLYSIPETIPKLRQAILQLAVQGKLVRQDPNDESASVLLKKVETEKENLINQKKIKRIDSLPAIDFNNLPYQIPKTWEWVRLGSLVEVITKGSSPKWQGINYVEDSSGTLFITSENVQNYVINITEPKFVEAKFNEIEPRSILKRNDILMNIVGASIGRTAIFDRDDIANINQAVCLIRFISPEKFIELRYILHFFNSPVCISFMFDKQVDSARANLSMGNIAKFPIPLPPLAEQKRIVEKCDRLMSLCDILEAKLKQGRDSSEKLMEVAAKQVLTA